MGDAVIQAEYLTETQWSLWALQTAAGVDTGAALWGNGLVQGSRPSDILRRDARIVVEGITVNALAAAAAPLWMYVETKNVRHHLYYIASSGHVTQNFAPLDFPVYLDATAWLNVFQAQALGDTIELSAWGHWQTELQPQEEAPTRVTLDSIVYPIKTRRF